jgi:hypothetical protein
MFCLALFGVSLAACASNDIRWTEEVKLSNGQVIQIQRHVELTESGFPAQKRGFDKYQEICYPPMNIHWKSKGGYKPDIFDIVDGRAYMHVPISDCFSCERYGYPSTDALYFVWTDGKWKRITHEEFPEMSEWNLLMQTKRGSRETDPQGLITIKDKTTGKWTDSTLRFDQKRLGWKRVSESSLRKGRCSTCRGVTSRNYGNNEDFLEVLVSDSRTTCQ